MATSTHPQSLDPSHAFHSGEIFEQASHASKIDEKTLLIAAIDSYASAAALNSVEAKAKLIALAKQIELDKDVLFHLARVLQLQNEAFLAQRCFCKAAAKGHKLAAKYCVES